MRFFTARRLVLAAVLPVLLTFTIIPGCAEESEGERCGDTTGANNSDCASGLTCVQIDNTPTFRCCNPARVTNSRCVVQAAAVGGAGGSAGSSGASGGAVAGTAGSADASAGQPSAATDAGAGGS